MRSGSAMIKDAQLLIAWQTFVGIFCIPKIHRTIQPNKIIRPVAAAIIVVTPLVAAPAMIPSSPAVVLTVTPLLHRFGETVLEAQRYLYIYNFFVLIYLFWLVCFTIERKFIFTVTMQCLWNSVQEGREKSHSSKCKQLKHRVSSGAATWLLQQFMGSSSTNAVAKNALFFSCKWI